MLLPMSSQQRSCELQLQDFFLILLQLQQVLASELTAIASRAQDPTARDSYHRFRAQKPSPPRIIDAHGRGCTYTTLFFVIPSPSFTSSTSQSHRSQTYYRSVTPLAYEARYTGIQYSNIQYSSIRFMSVDAFGHCRNMDVTKTFPKCHSSSRSLL